MDAAAPYAPVVSAREGTPDDIEILCSQHIIIGSETGEEVIFRSHCSVEYAVTAVEFLLVIKDRQMGFGTAKLRETHETAENTGISE